MSRPDNVPPVKGGQGRSDADVEASGWVLVWILACALAWGLLYILLAALGAV